MKSYFRLLLLLGVCSPLALHAETAQEILEKHERAKADALQAYIDANPDAEDNGAARDFLINALGALGDTDAMVPLFEEKMAGFGDKQMGQDDLQDYFGVMMPLFELYSEGGKKDEASTLIDNAEKSLTGLMQQNPQIGQQIGQMFGQMKQQLAMPSVGDTMDIKFESTAGDEIDLAAMKGKVVLVDFWATWCGPCVAEMPNVIAAYNKHHENGFEVIGISLDQDQGAMANYITENKMPWPQYYDGKGWGNEIAGKFGIGSIPATFLIGKDGKIAASNLRGPALEEKVAELLGGDEG